MGTRDKLPKFQCDLSKVISVLVKTRTRTQGEFLNSERFLRMTRV